MDSITQMALGGALGVLVGGKKYGKKSLLMGAMFGSVPDMDVFFFIGSDPVTSFTHHRGFTHSLSFAFLATPILGYLISKIKWFGASYKDIHLHLIIFLALFTHPLLDALTIYGTQLLWPSSSPPVGLGSVFIIDLLYTVPLLVGIGLFIRKGSCRANVIGLTLSSLYLALGIGAQHYIYSKVYKQVDVDKKNVLVQARPLNPTKWRVIVMHDSKYEVGYYSIFNKDDTVEFQSYARGNGEQYGLSDHADYQRLKWFTKGFYDIQLSPNKNLTFSDLRMGQEPGGYIFQFELGEVSK